MKYKDEIAGIVEPELKDMFDNLNQRFFLGRLPLPDALAWDYRNRRSGGSILTTENGSHCYYIVVRGKQKHDQRYVELTMLHEMLHLSLSLQFYYSDLSTLKYSRVDFVKDESASFLLEASRLAQEYGCSLKEFLVWSSKTNPDKATKITKKSYTEIKDAQSVLATLWDDD